MPRRRQLPSCIVPSMPLLILCVGIATLTIGISHNVMYLGDAALLRMAVPYSPTLGSTNLFEFALYPALTIALLPLALLPSIRLPICMMLIATFVATTTLQPPALFLYTGLIAGICLKRFHIIESVSLFFTFCITGLFVVQSTTGQSDLTLSHLVAMYTLTVLNPSLWFGLITTLVLTRYRVGITPSLASGPLILISLGIPGASGFFIALLARDNPLLKISAILSILMVGLIVLFGPIFK